MRVMIFGPTGMLGHQLLKEAINRDYQIWALSRSKPVSSFAAEALSHVNVQWITPIDAIKHRDAIDEWIGEIHPDVMVNAAGLVKQAPGGEDMAELLPINALFPRALQIMALKWKTKLIHVSSDCVFDGQRGFYHETDVPNAHDAYGQSKILGEVLGPYCLTLRTSIVGPELSTKRGLYEWFRHQAPGRVHGFTRSIFSGVSTVYLAHLIWDVAEQYPHLEGLFHVATEPISKYDLLVLIRDTLNLRIRIIPDSTVFCNRSLNPRKFFEATGIMPPPWQEMVYDLARSSLIR
ncbi:MAG: SDR family NAD(P)-dependent oxidoreductase [Sulfobacillus thermosulfidooxidans]|uniref:dTDP-4-dehydrorhamnose reductase n=1 Tax=Sulfobacillus thermosulfidooxidans TaxID=28034 RepID=A0A2T2WYM8_SULTH|nr:SDR family oxidoreductase [Sulfobacillus thermosulfidooxidans]PSR27344.1 MAG: SDR family NAD(P)-dependent oxidoreductase [Sulfobacillus thermosulfidooxidans]